MESGYRPIKERVFMSDHYKYRRGSTSFGPYSRDEMLALIEKGRVGRHSRVSKDGGDWEALDAYPELLAPHEYVSPKELWHYTMAGTQQAEPIAADHLIDLIRSRVVSDQELVWNESIGNQWVPITSVTIFAAEIRTLNPLEETNEEGGPSIETDEHPVGRSNAFKRVFQDDPIDFICMAVSIAVIALLTLPCIAFLFAQESMRWTLSSYLVGLLTFAGVAALVLGHFSRSVSPKKRRNPTGAIGSFAVAMGISVLVLGFFFPHRLYAKRAKLIESTQVSIKVLEKDLVDTLARYRLASKQPNESDGEFGLRREQLRKAVGEPFGALIEANDKLEACVNTSQFQEAFYGLFHLEENLAAVDNAAKTVESLGYSDVLSSAGRTAHPTILNTYRLFRNGELTVSEAEAHVAGKTTPASSNNDLNDKGAMLVTTNE